MSNINNFLNSIVNNDKDGAKAIFNDIMSEKIVSVIDAMKIEVAQTMFEGKDKDKEDNSADDSKTDNDSTDEDSDDESDNESDEDSDDESDNESDEDSDDESDDSKTDEDSDDESDDSKTDEDSDDESEAKIHKATKIGMKEETLDEGKAQPSDDRAAKELYLHGINAESHYKNADYIIKNLSKKHDKGVYGHDKAKTLWGYHADRVAKDYTKQYGGTFSKSTRMKAAEHFRDHYNSHVRGEE